MNAARVLRIQYDVLPPSDNRIRDVGFRVVQGRRKAVICYTDEATNYKALLIRHINDHYFVDVQRFARGHVPGMLYCLTTVLHFPEWDILNKSWPATALSPYKKVDVMNRRKLIEDGLSTATGIDDSLFWLGDVIKVVSPDGLPRIDMILEEVDPASHGVPVTHSR